MKKIRLILCLNFFFLFSLSAQEYNKWGISTNIPLYILLSPNIKGELYINSNFAMYIGGSYGWWDLDWDKKKEFRQWHVNAGYNYYLRTKISYTSFSEVTPTTTEINLHANYLIHKTL